MSAPRFRLNGAPEAAPDGKYVLASDYDAYVGTEGDDDFPDYVTHWTRLPATLTLDGLAVIVDERETGGNRV